MPVPRYGVTTGDRPSGLVVPPCDLSGVTELRVHGVGGATAQDVLGDLAPLQVAGDRLAGFYRTADLRGRHVEAYSLGGLNSHSSWRVLWVLLLPFMLTNVAGWMCSTRARSSALYRWLMRCGSLMLTLNALLLLAMLSVDVIAFQCGNREAWTAGRWWLAPLRWEAVAAFPGRRILLGSLLPAVLLVVLALLSSRTRHRYESVRPPHRDGAPRPTAHPSAPALHGGLSDSDFWDGRRTTRRLGQTHTAASLSLLTVLILLTTQATYSSGDLAWRFPTVGSTLLVAALIIAAAVGPRRCHRRRSRPRDLSQGCRRGSPGP